MKIKSLTINRIQGIQHFEISDFSDSVTLLIGKVGSGKSTILASIFSFFCDTEIVRWRDSDVVNNIGQLSIDIRNKNSNINIDKNILPEGNHYTFSCEQNQDYLLGELRNRAFYYRSRLIKDGFTINQFNETIAFLNKYDMNIGHLLPDRVQAKILYMGQLEILNIVFFISKIPPGSVVLLDSFYFLDDPTVGLLLELFNKINYLQFICAFHGNRSVDYNVKKVYLTDEIISKEINNNEILFRLLDNNTLKIDNDNSEKLLFVKYKINDVLQEDEDIEVEYKSIKGYNPSRSIKDIADQYVVAFLNSTKIKCGIIKWGITDDGIVEGVVLNRKARDEIRRDIQSCINNIMSAIDSSCYELKFEKIMDNKNEIITDLYVVELIVYSSTSKILYATGGGDVYLKFNGVKQKLSTYQIQTEVLKRNGF